MKFIALAAIGALLFSEAYAGDYDTVPGAAIQVEQGVITPTPIQATQVSGTLGGCEGGSKEQKKDRKWKTSHIGGKRTHQKEKKENHGSQVSGEAKRGGHQGRKHGKQVSKEGREKSEKGKCRGGEGKSRGRGDHNGHNPQKRMYQKFTEEQKAIYDQSSEQQKKEIMKNAWKKYREERKEQRDGQKDKSCDK